MKRPIISNVNIFTTQIPFGQILDDYGSGAISYELGTRFSSSVDGFIKGLRFYRAASASTTSRTLRLWSSGGTQLATATTSAESGTGWISANLSSPYAITAGTEYVCSYGVPADYYVYTTGLHNSVINSLPLTAPIAAGRYSDSGGGGGVGVFPALVYTNEAYFADVIFSFT